MAETGTMTGDGFGGALRRERERRGVSLQELSKETKVGIGHLRALEEDEFKALPGGVFRRGIVRAYLKVVGLEEEEWMPRFLQSHEAQMGSPGAAAEPGGEEWEAFADAVRRNRGQSRKERDWRWVGVALLFVLVLVAACLVWRFEVRGRVSRNVEPEPTRAEVLPGAAAGFRDGSGEQSHPI